MHNSWDLSVSVVGNGSVKYILTKVANATDTCVHR